MSAGKNIILVTDPLGEEGMALLHEAGFEIAEGEGGDPASYAGPLAEASAWIVRSGTQVTADLVAKGSNLKVVGRAGTGLDNIDQAACGEHGVKVLNTPGANTLAAGELTVALMLTLARRVQEAGESLRKGEWKRAKLAGTELGGKTLGLVGFGRIGRVVATRAKAFDMKVIAYDPFLGADDIEAGGAEPAELDELIAGADYLSLLLRVNVETRGMMGAAQLASLKPGARLVNVAGGGLVDEAALAKSIAEGHLAGAAIDVWDGEPPAADNPLLGMPQVVVTPHLGASTAEAKKRVGLEICTLIRDFLQAQ